jgi:hypothetical protein
VAAVACLVVALGVLSLNRGLRVEESWRHTGDLRLRTAWLRDAAPGAVVLSDEPQLDFLYGERRTVRYPTAWRTNLPAVDELAPQLRATGATHVLIAPALAWQPIHQARLNPEGDALLDRVRQLEQRGEARLVHASDGAALYVFELAPAGGG